MPYGVMRVDPRLYLSFSKLHCAIAPEPVTIISSSAVGYAMGKPLNREKRAVKNGESQNYPAVSLRECRAL